MQPIAQTMVGVHRSQPPRADLPRAESPRPEVPRVKPQRIDLARPEPQRADLQRQAESHACAAEAAALAGDVETAAREILKGLDCERRAGSVGPQVLQLIKPRT